MKKICFRWTLSLIMVTAFMFSAAAAIPGAEASEKLVSLQEFVLMAAETLDAPIIQSEAEMSAMRYAYKAG